MNNIIIAPPSYHPIHRQNGSTSRQPRFNEVKPQQFFNSLMRFTQSDIQQEPPWGDEGRDEWLRKVWPQEPYLAGVINSVVNIDKNRGWTITGGRNQVNRFVDILHNRFFYAPDLSGWRVSFGGSSLSYWTSDLGNVTELGRLENENGPLDAMWFVDPVRCSLTGDNDRPLKYKPIKGDPQLWRRDDYFRVVSLPSTDEGQYGLGLCALSRCIELAKIMVGIYQYDNEMLLNQAPRGLLLLKGITEDQWEDAMAARKARLEGDELKYYGAVNVLAALDPGVEIEAQLVALSQLPAEFNQQVFTDLLMYGYALCFGYDPREFWPVSAGALGTATETEAQHRKAGAKGGLDFPLGYSERLNEELPDTILFDFEERDEDGELATAAVEQAQTEVIMSLFEKGAGIITMEEARVLAAERGLIDSDWTLEQEDTVATDEGEERKRRMLEQDRIQRAIARYPDEPIVEYAFRNNKHHWRTLRKPSPRRKLFQVTRATPTYEQQVKELADRANNDDITQDEFQTRLDALTIAALTLSLLRGVNKPDNETAQLLNNAAELIMQDDSQKALDTSLSVLTDGAILSDIFDDTAIAGLEDNINLASASTLAGDIYSGQYASEGLDTRLALWAIPLVKMTNLGKATGNPDTLYRWEVGNTEKHCGDCGGFEGQVKSGAEWAAGLMPQDSTLECGGFRCQCELVEA